MEVTDNKEKKKWRAPFQDIRWFMLFYYITCCAVWGALSHNNAITRTLEKRFGLSGFQSGFILSVNDIVNMVLVLFVGYLGRSISKPHFLGIMCIMGAVGCGLFALPYPLYPGIQADNSTNTPLLCLPIPRENVTCEEETEAASNSNQAYGLLLVASAILGIGNSGLGVLSLSYIDENTPRNVAALYIGIASSANTIGPLFGFLLAFLTLRLPEDLKESQFEQDDERFIGCWWLAFVIWAVVMLLGSIGMLLCPKHLPYYYEQKEKAKLELKKAGITYDKDKNKKKTAKEIAMETWSNLKSVFTNVPYVFLVFSTLLAYYIVPGVFGQIPKYLVVQFKIDQAMTAVYTGISVALVLSIALIILGWFIKTVKLQLRGAIFMFTIAIVGTVLSLVGMTFWECDQPQLAGAVDVTTYDIPYYPECQEQANCKCTGVQPMCSPVDDLTFASPCHAGCNRVNITQEGVRFINCACVRGTRGNISTLGEGWVQGGLCPKPVCNSFIGYLLFVALMSCCSAAARLAAVILQLRFVRNDMKSFAIGLTSFLHNGLAFVPGPILFGAIFDTSCVLWQELECGQTGACIKYNMDDYRLYMHGITLGFQILALFLIVPMYRASRPLFHIQPATEQLFSSDTNVNGNVVQSNGTSSEKPHLAKDAFSEDSEVNKKGIINEGADLSDGFTGVENKRDEKTPL